MKRRKDPNGVNYYKATGLFTFPLDMLRRDSAFVHPDVVHKDEDGFYFVSLSSKEYEPGEILVMYPRFKGCSNVPDHTRWRSFSWELSLDTFRFDKPDMNWITFNEEGIWKPETLRERVKRIKLA
jgi:hypothetical protein